MPKDAIESPTRNPPLREQSKAPQNLDQADDAVVNSVEQATLLIRNAILSGHYGPGVRIKVAELSTSFGLSAMPLREALRKLEGEGLVEIEPNRGATVRGLDRRFIEELYELNTELQVLAIRRGMAGLTFDKLDELESMSISYDEATSRGDVAAGIKLNRELHAAIVAIGGNLEALRIFQRGWELISAFRLRFGYGRGRERGLVREHRALLDALRRQDLPLAEAVIRMQTAANLQDLLSRMDGSGVKS
jgi:DNA-binding GntR family transcriptional regulator